MRGEEQVIAYSPLFMFGITPACAGKRVVNYRDARRRGS